MGLLICPCCGRQKEIKPLKRTAKYFCSNCGTRDLIAYRRVKWWMDADEKPGLQVEQAQIVTFSGLLWLAVSRGYKPGWAALKFRSLLGDWPPDFARVGEPTPPSIALVKWSEKEKQRYARMQRKLEAQRILSAAPPIEAKSELMTEADWRVEL